jgi:hypothetical protein
MTDKLVPPFEDIDDTQSLLDLELRIQQDYPDLGRRIGGVISLYLMRLDAEGDVIELNPLDNTVGLIESIVESELSR